MCDLAAHTTLLAPRWAFGTPDVENNEIPPRASLKLIPIWQDL